MSTAALTRILRPAEAARLLGISRQTIWRLRRDPASGFPAAIRVSPGAVGFREDELIAYVDGRRGRAENGDGDDEAT